MERITVHSSNVAEVGYDPKKMTLEVMFYGGNIYHYLDVPQLVYQELVEAESVGTFLNTHIKDVYKYVKL